MNDQTEVKVTNQTYRNEAGEVVSRKVVDRETSQTADAVGTSVNIVYLFYGTLAGLLAIRMLLSLLAANKGNVFADFIYTVTSPFVAPFRSLFGVDTSIGNGSARFELKTLVAIGVYGLIAWLIARLLRVRKEQH